MLARPLNDRQIEVLQWIAEGRPVGTMAGGSFKNSAVALRNRHLVHISKRGGWHATITDAGLYYLEHGQYPTQDGEGVLPARSEPRQETVPPGAQVPPSLRSRRLLAGDVAKRLHTRRVLRTRALRLAGTLMAKCEERGWTVLPVHDARDAHGRPWQGESLFVIDTGEYLEGVRIGTHASQSQAADLTGPPRGLFVEIDSRKDGRQAHWSDGKRMFVEAKLDRVVEAIAGRSDAHRDRRLAEEDTHALRHDRQQAAVTAAVAQLREQQRHDLFAEQVEHWYGAIQGRRFLAAMERRIAALVEPSEITRANEWLSWCRRAIHDFDPLEQPLGFPDERTPTFEELEPYLPAWFLGEDGDAGATSS